MKTFTYRTVAIAVLAGLGFVESPLHSQTPAADLILSNGKIITVDERFSVAQAVALKGDRIVAVGRNQDVAQFAGPNTRRIDLQGKAVVPGLIDNHMHLLRAGSTWQWELRFDGVDSRKKAIDMLRARVKASAPGEWIYNIGGWATHQFTDDKRPFTREELDEIAPNTPVALQESYYAVFLNSKALHAFGIEPNAPDPSDFVKGSIVRDASGRPTGVIKGDIAATRPVAARLPKHSKEQVEASSLAMLKDMNRAGLTSFGVAGCDPEILQTYRAWEQHDQLNVRVFCIGGAAAANPEQVERSVRQIAQMKLFQGDTYIDQVFFGESVYTPLHDPMFRPRSEPGRDQLEQWRRMAVAIAEAGLPLHVHAELETTIDAFLDQIEAITTEHPIKNLRWTLAHMNQVNARQLERMKKLGMYLAVHPWTVINGGIYHEEFGDVAYDMPPFSTIQSSGIMWGLGTDATAANQYLPFTTLCFAVTGKLGGTKVNRQTISREDALIAHTRKNAFFVFQEDNLGAIQPGKLADLVVLDRDYLTIPADEIKDIKPQMTIVGGRIVHDATAR
jgi:predicted amidohydrolase YtcJ